MALVKYIIKAWLIAGEADWCSIPEHSVNINFNWFSDWSVNFEVFIAFLSLTIASKDDLGPVHTYPYSFEKATCSLPLATFSPVHTYKRILLTIVYIFPH